MFGASAPKTGVVDDDDDDDDDSGCDSDFWMVLVSALQ